MNDKRKGKEILFIRPKDYKLQSAINIYRESSPKIHQSFARCWITNKAQKLSLRNTTS